MTNSDSWALGLDIGGTNLKVAAVQKPNRIGFEFSVPSHAADGPEAVRTAVREAVLRARSQGGPFSAIGVGCAGSVDPKTGVVRQSPNFSHWRDVPLKEWLQKDHELPVTVENDANCAVVTEWKLGAARGCRNVLLLTLGTGIGGGLILEDRLFRGSTGTAGEAGHVTIRADGVPCPCGNIGCLERYCSASALERVAPGVPPKIVFDPANRAKYQDVVETFLQDLSLGLTSLANLLDPDVILLGGGIAPGVTPHLERMSSWMKARAFSAVAKHVRLLPAAHGHNSGAIGAALLALYPQ